MGSATSGWVFILKKQKQAEYISHFSVVMIKHHDQGNLRKSLFGLWLKKVRVYDKREIMAAGMLRAHILNHRYEAEKQLGAGETLSSQSLPPVT